MTEHNPYRLIARSFAFACYMLAFFILCASLFFIVAAANMDLTQMRGLEGVTNARMTVMMISMFAIIILMISLLGWRAQRVFGQHHRPDKPIARATVGCLRLGSLGCGLWILPTALTIITTGQILATGELAGVQDLFIGASGFFVAILLMMSVSWFISTNFARLNVEERKHAFQAYMNAVQAGLSKMADPETRAHLQQQTLDLLPKLDLALKGTLLENLSESHLLTGNTRIVLRNADFRGVDLRRSDLPEADLREINLEHAGLEGALLSKVNLYKARLKRCNLSRAR